MVLYVMFSLVMKHTRYGRNVFAVGSNEKDDGLAGIKVRNIKLSTYVLSYIIAFLEGVIHNMHFSYYFLHFFS